MRRFVIAAAIALLSSSLTAAAHAQDSEIDCSAFLKNSDGSWTVINLVFIPVQKVRVRPGTVFKPGQTFLGDDMTERLAKACPNQPVATPPPAEGQTAQPAGQPQTQPGPFVPLSTYADANGNIDIQSLTCAQLAVASPADTGLLVTWYSGWYAGLGKRRGINMARVQYAISNVADYCKANRNQRLGDALNILLKPQ
jgi:HdeA/HdeB family